MSRDRDDQVVGRVAFPVVPVEIPEPDVPDRLRGPEDRLPEGVGAPEGTDEHLVHEVVGAVVRLADFLEDDSPLDLDVVRLERRRQHDISQQLQGFSEPGVQGMRVEARVLLGREGIHVAAETSVQTQAVKKTVAASERRLSNTDSPSARCLMKFNNG